MPDNKNRTISDKDHYHQLTDRQKAVVDALAAEPDAIQEEIAERATEDLDEGESVNRSYVSVIKNKYPHIIKQQQEQFDNERYTGEETTEGNPLESMDEQLGSEERGVSTFGERNVTSTQGESTQEPTRDTTESAEENAEISVTLTRDEAIELATSGCSESFQNRLATMLVENSARVSV